MPHILVHIWLFLTFWNSPKANFVEHMMENKYFRDVFWLFLTFAKWILLFLFRSATNSSTYLVRFEFLIFFKSLFCGKYNDKQIFQRRLLAIWDICKWILQFLDWYATNSHTYLVSFEFLKFFKSLFLRRYDDEQVFQRHLLAIWDICKWILQFLDRFATYSSTYLVIFDFLKFSKS